MTATRKETPKKPATAPRGRGALAASRQSARLARTAARREAILEAALDEFSARGFAAARLEDVAKRAGVAKGTIYLYFADKEALFQELVRFQIGPVMSAFETVLASPLPLKSLMDQAIEIFAREVYGTRRREVIRLMIGEGPRFPAIADFYYREVVSRGLAAMRGLIQLGIARGEIRVPALANYPQIVVAPAMIAVIWKSLFERHAPLDAMAMLRVHLDLIFGERSAS